MATSKALLSKLGVTLTSLSRTLGSKLLIVFSISDRIELAVKKSKFSNNKLVTFDPIVGSNGFSPGMVKTKLRIERAMAFSFLRTIKSELIGLT